MVGAVCSLLEAVAWDSAMLASATGWFMGIPGIQRVCFAAGAFSLLGVWRRWSPLGTIFLGLSCECPITVFLWREYLGEVSFLDEGIGVSLLDCYGEMRLTRIGRGEWDDVAFVRGWDIRAATCR